jgi:RNA polymerase sigma-70 factor (ECF subfamily)
MKRPEGPANGEGEALRGRIAMQNSTTTYYAAAGTYEDVVLPELSYLRGRALALTRHREDAEDLLQDTCVKAFRSFRSFRQGSNVRAWLSRILTNTFITAWRSRSSRDSRGTTIPLEDAPELAQVSAPSHPTDPHQALEVKRQQEAVDDLLTSLLPQFHTTLRLHIEGLSYREIAASETVPIGTVMSRLHRARRQAAERLKGYDQRVTEAPRDAHRAPPNEGTSATSESRSWTNSCRCSCGMATCSCRSSSSSTRSGSPSRPHRSCSEPEHWPGWDSSISGSACCSSSPPR